MTTPGPDPRFMREAIAQALKGKGRTHPNPCVGAVVVKDGMVVGKGYHKGPGCPHAEIEALQEAGAEARGADLYVTLEPCNVYGRTPPCTGAILSAGLARVFAAGADPNPQVCGKGSEELSRKGVEVVMGFLEDEARAVDLAYHAYHMNRRPYVHLKIAQSLDGRVTSPSGGYITGPEARRHVHEDRFLSDAILVSAGTVKADDSRLTVRLENQKKSLVRVVLDSGRVITGGEALFTTCPQNGPVWIVRPEAEGTAAPDFAGREGVEVLFLPGRASGGFPLGDLLALLYRKKIVELYVEAVGRLAGAFLSERYVDRISIHIAPLLLGGEGQPGAVDDFTPAGGLRLEKARCTQSGEDWIVTASLEGRCLPV